MSSFYSANIHFAALRAKKTPTLTVAGIPALATPCRVLPTQNYQMRKTQRFSNTLGKCAESMKTDTEISASKGVEIFYQTKLARPVAAENLPIRYSKDCICLDPRQENSFQRRRPSLCFHPPNEGHGDALRTGQSEPTLSGTFMSKLMIINARPLSSFLKAAGSEKLNILFVPRTTLPRKWPFPRNSHKNSKKLGKNGCREPYSAFSMKPLDFAQSHSAHRTIT